MPDETKTKKVNRLRLQKLREYDVIEECGEQKFREIAKLASRFCDTAYAGIHLIDEDTQRCKISYGIPVEDMPRSESVCTYTIQSSEPFIRANLNMDDRFKNKFYVTGEPHFAAYAGVPLETEAGQRIGSLCVMDTEPREFTDEHIETLQLLAGNVVAHLELYLRNRQLEKKNEQVEEHVIRRDAIIKEIHHRLKNNLSYIIGILDMELMNNHNLQIQHIIKKVQKRIMSVVAIHQRLYESNKLEHIRVKSYLEDLSQDIRKSFTDSTQDIKCRVTGDDLILDNKRITPFGLLMSELLINAFKHAYEGLQRGKLTIHLEYADDLYRIEICDDGVGLPDDFELYESDSMGSRLIVSFLEQLDADIEWFTDGGTCFNVTFPSR